MINIYEMEMERGEIIEAYKLGELTLERAYKAFLSANAGAMVFI